MATITENFETIYGLIQAKAQIELDAGRIIDSQYATIMGSALIELIRQSMVLEKTNVDNRIKEEQWVIQEEVLGYQRDMALIDRNKKQVMVDVDYDNKVKQGAQIAADTDFTVSKKDVMEWTRKDNVRIKATAEFADFLKYLSAANVVPSKEDFENIRKLIIAINEGVTTEDAIATIPVSTTTDFQAV